MSAEPARATPAWYRALLQFYRLAVLVGVAWIIRAHAVHLRVSGLTPVTVAEVRALLPAAADLRDDPGERSGVFVHDANGARIGYALRTAPVSDSIVGYCGWTDSLVVFDPALHVLGVRIRSSQDTRDHVGDVKGDPYFLKTWNGKAWDEIARTAPQEAGIEGVSGATLTSMAVAEGIHRRLLSTSELLAAPRMSVRWKVRDTGLILVVVAATLLAFIGTYRKAWLRRAFQVFVIVYVGFISADLLAQSLFAGWAGSGLPWRTAPGLVLLFAAALVIPWTSGKPLYCQHICPHGAAQELLHRIAPRNWRLHIRADVDRALRWLPPGLLFVVLGATLLLLPIDPAHLEPFDAYAIRSAGWATITIAILGLLASLFVPVAYCHYGCPTGALLNFIRRHGSHDQFGRRELTALLLVAFAWLLSRYHVPIHAWMVAD